MSERIPLAEPCIGGNAREYLDECISTNFVSSVGPFVERFEREFAHAVGAKHAVACATGTAAIHVAMRLAGLEPGDEVFVSTLTFIASANPVVYERATPVLVDAESQTLNLAPELIVEELDTRARTGRKMPRVVEVVHILGQPANIEPIADACEKHGVMLVEDAAESLGATYNAGRFAGKQVGTIGAVGCFSFNGNKVITTGGGGMITTNDASLARRAKHLTTQARLPGIWYEHDEIGFNYRLTNLAAALGVAQLEQLSSFLQRKESLARRYDNAFARVPKIQSLERVEWASSSNWMYSIRLREGRLARDRMLAGLREVGIEARPIWTPLHRFRMYDAAPRIGSGAVADDLFDRCVSLPSSVSLAESEQDRVIRHVIEIAMS